MTEQITWDMTNTDRTVAAKDTAKNAAESAIRMAMADGIEDADYAAAYDAAYCEAYAGYANDNKDLWGGVGSDAIEVAWNAINPN